MGRKRKGNIFGDLGKMFVNTLASPFEALSGQNFYDPKMSSDFGRGAFKVVEPINKFVGGATAAIGTTFLNKMLPGAGDGISQGAQAAGTSSAMTSQPPMQMSNKTRATATANPYGLSSGNMMANEKMTPGMDTKKFANGGPLGGGDPKSKAAIKNLKKAAAEKPYYGGELPGVTVKGQIPEWLQISRQYEQMKPKQDFVKNYPKKQMGVRFSKKQKEEAYEKEKMRYVAENLIANKINRSAEEAANNNGNPIRPQFTDYEKQIIFNNSDPETLRMVFPEDVSWMQYNYPTWKDKGQAAMAVGQWIPGIGKVAKGAIDVAQPGLDFVEAYSLSGNEGVVDQAKQTALETALFNLKTQQPPSGPFGKTRMLPVLPKTAQDLWETRHALPFEQRMMLGEDTDNPTFKQLYKHQDGGPVNPNSMDSSNVHQMVKNQLAANANKNFVQRIVDPNAPSTNVLGVPATHLMGYATVDNGAIAFPNIVQGGSANKLQMLTPTEAINHAFNTGEFIPFNSEKEADLFTRNYKTEMVKKFSHGGMLKQYNAPTHEDGGQMVDGRGNPTTNPKKAVGEIEKKETSWNNYVFSDTLGENGKTFAQMSKAIANRYKGKRDPLSKKTMEKEMKMLIQKNEAAREAKEREEAEMLREALQGPDQMQQMSMQQGQPQMSQEQMMQMMMQQQMMQQGQGQPMPQGMEQQMPQEGGEFRWGGGLDFPTYPYQNGGMLQVPEAPLDEYKKGGWIQKATASIKRRGTEGVCTGSKFGGPSCPPGSKRYNLAKTFKAMAKKHEDGGFIDSMPDLNLANYEMGGMLPEFGDGGYTVTRSNERKGKTHKVTGPDGTVKFFGDPDLKNNPSEKAKDAFYARHKKNLEGNPHFRAYARATWKNGGYMPQYPDGGELPLDEQRPYRPKGSYTQNRFPQFEEIPYLPSVIPSPYTVGQKPQTIPGFQDILNSVKTKDFPQFEGMSSLPVPFLPIAGSTNIANQSVNPEPFVQQPFNQWSYGNQEPVGYSTNSIPEGQPVTVTNQPTNTQQSEYGEEGMRLRPLEYASIGLKGLALGKSMYDALQPAEKEQLRLNREAGLVNNMMAGRNVNLAAALNEAMYNRNAALASNQARSANVQRALDMQTYTNAERNAIRAKLEERAMNNALRSEEANTRMNLGAMEAAERIRRQNIQSQNEAAQRDFGRQFFSDLSNVGNQLYKAQMYKDLYKNKQDIFTNQFRESVALLKQVDGNWQVFGKNADAILEKLRRGTPLTQEDYDTAMTMIGKASQITQNQNPNG
jgi:hypothetical protein